MTVVLFRYGEPTEVSSPSIGIRQRIQGLLTMPHVYNEDLFESTKMSFGEHLEELRICLVRHCWDWAWGFCWDCWSPTTWSSESRAR